MESVRTAIIHELTNNGHQNKFMWLLPQDKHSYATFFVHGGLIIVSCFKSLYLESCNMFADMLQYFKYNDLKQETIF